MIIVTGATGQLGRLVIDGLLDAGVPADGIVAAVRSPQKAADLTARGVEVREADYNRPETLASAFAGASKVLLISSSEVGQRVEQHRNAVAAAAASGAQLLAYTSILAADRSAMQLAGEHRATEELVQAAGLPYTLLRNGWYVENYTGNLATALAHGSVLGSAGEGRVAAATRADFAAAAVAVLTTDGHQNRIYELGSDEAFTLGEYAAELTRQTGKPIGYVDLSAADYTAALAGAGLPEPFAALLADSDLGIARGELTTDSGDLSRLIGRPTTPLADAVKLALAAA